MGLSKTGKLLSSRMREEFSCDSMWVYPKLSDKDTPNDPNGDMIWKVNFPTPFKSMGIPGSDLLEVPTIYKAYFSGLCKGISLENMHLYSTVPPFQDPEIPID